MSKNILKNDPGPCKYFTAPGEGAERKPCRASSRSTTVLCGHGQRPPVPCKHFGHAEHPKWHQPPKNGHLPQSISMSWSPPKGDFLDEKY